MIVQPHLPAFTNQILPQKTELTIIPMAQLFTLPNLQQKSVRLTSEVDHNTAASPIDSIGSSSVDFRALPASGCCPQTGWCCYTTCFYY